MKFENYKHLAGLLAIILLATAVVMLGAPPATGLWIVGLWQLSQFAMSKRRAVCFTGGLTPEQAKEFEKILTGLKDYEAMFKELHAIGKEEGGWAAIKQLPSLLKTLSTDNDELRKKVKKLTKELAKMQFEGNGVKWIGRVPFVTNECAKALSAAFVIDLSMLEGGTAFARAVPEESKRIRMLNYSAECLGMDLAAAQRSVQEGKRESAVTKTALDTTTIPVPTMYMSQITELVWKFGQARQRATVYPLGGGTTKLPRLQAGEDDFGYLGVGTAGMSQAVPEKRVTAELVTFNPSKAGGLVRIPTELEEDTFIQLGQFLARYIARQFAKLEDKTLFIGDGTATYANIVGVSKYCINNAASYLVQLGAGKTKPSDATIADFRALRSKVNAAVLVDDPAYYLNPTMESLLSSFNTIGQPLIYKPQSGGSPATLDGFEIVWTQVLQAFDQAAHASSILSEFGALSYWYLGERGSARVEVSREVFFATDEIAMRALERIDVEALAIDAMSTLQAAAQ